MGTHMTQQRSSTFQNTEDTPEAARPNALFLHKSLSVLGTPTVVSSESGRAAGFRCCCLSVRAGLHGCLLPEVTASRFRLGSRGCPPVTSPTCIKTLPTQVCGQAPALRISVDRTGNAPQPRLPVLPWKPSTCGRDRKREKPASCHTADGSFLLGCPWNSVHKPSAVPTALRHSPRAWARGLGGQALG